MCSNRSRNMQCAHDACIAAQGIWRTHAKHHVVKGDLARQSPIHNSRKSSARLLPVGVTAWRSPPVTAQQLQQTAPSSSCLFPPSRLATAPVAICFWPSLLRPPWQLHVTAANGGHATAQGLAETAPNKLKAAPASSSASSPLAAAAAHESTANKHLRHRGC